MLTIKKNAVSVKVDGEMTPIGMLGESVDKFITVNEEDSSKFTKMHIEVSDDEPETELLEKTDIIDNLVTTTKGYALDARQGKALDDKITGVQQDLTQLASNLKVVTDRINFTTANTPVRKTFNISNNGLTPKCAFVVATGSEMSGLYMNYYVRVMLHTEVTIDIWCSGVKEIPIALCVIY